MFKSEAISQLEPSRMRKNALWGLGLALLVLLASASIGAWGEYAFFIFIALLVGIASLVVSLLHERFPLYLLVAMLPLAEMLRVEYIPSTLLVIPGGLAVISLLASVAFRRKTVFIHSSVLVIAVLLGIWASIATASIGSISESRPYWLVIILLFLVPNLLTQVDHLLRASWLFLLPLGGLGLYVFVNRLIFYFTAYDLDVERLHLAQFGVGGKNIVGLWLTLGIPFAYYLFEYYQGQSVKRFWLLVAGVSMLAGALASLSIGVAFGLVVLVGMIVWFQPNVNNRFRAFVLGIITLPLIFNGLLVERLQRQQLLTPDDAWGTYRGELWNAGLHTILDNPLFGIGMEPTRRIALIKYIDEWFIQQWYNQGILVVPHNILLSVGVDTGLPGLILYVTLIGAILFLLWNLRRKLEKTENRLLRTLATILLVSLICGWAQGIGLSVHLDKLLWFLMGSAVALVCIADNETHPINT